MKNIYLHIAVSLFLCLGLASCGKEESDDHLDKKENKDIPTQISVKPGMNLVGLVKDSITHKPIKGVMVSDGYTCAVTDEDGVYQLARNEHAVFVYYSIPSAYEVPAEEGLPKFYERIDKSQTVFRKDFSLIPLKEKEDNFTLLCIADPQCKTENDIKRFTEETAVDLKKKAATYQHVYGITLGDIVFDTPDNFPAMKKALNVEGLKIFQVIGNHDHYQYAANDYACRENFENTFGPVNYSFNRGNVHIVALDDIIYEKSQKYTGGLTDEIFEWLKADLAQVSDDKMVILCVHIPFRNSSSINHNADVVELLSRFKEAHIMSGHTHYNLNYIYPTSDSKLFYEHVQGAACGNWWTCTMNGDGTPNGYGVYEISSNHIANWYYKGTNLKETDQIRVYPVGSFDDESGYLIANVWNIDKDWKIMVYENGEYTGDMTRFYDYDKAMYAFFKSMGKTPPTLTSPITSTSWFRALDHQYRYVPKSKTASIEVRAIDRFGNIYRQSKMINDFSTFESY